MGYKKLYIIGNGFDRHHKIESAYSDFKKWLEINQKEYNALCLIINYFHVDSEFWYDFENNLSKFNVVDFTEIETKKYYPDFLSEYFAREIDNAFYQSRLDFEQIYKEIQLAFHNWICDLNQPENQKRIDITIKDSYFINFNYTKTLENLYQVPMSKIWHIHGCIDTDETFVLGHGNRVSTDIALGILPELPSNCETIEQIEKFYQNNYDSILVDVAEHIVYCVNTILRKNVDGIIADNFYLFEDLKNLEEIHIYGWSFSSVDIPYLKEIINRNDISKLKWIISWFNVEDKKKVMDFLKSYNINPLLINFVRLIDLVIDTQKKLF